MKIEIIATIEGHIGEGKSQFLHRLEYFLRSCYDVDDLKIAEEDYNKRERLTATLSAR